MVRSRSATCSADKRSLATDSTRVLLSENQAIARQEVHDGACRNREDVGEEIMKSELGYEQPHQQDVAGDRNHAVRQVKSEEPARDSASIPPGSFRPGPALVPYEIVKHGALDGDRGRGHVIHADNRFEYGEDQ